MNTQQEKSNDINSYEKFNDSDQFLSIFEEKILELSSNSNISEENLLNIKNVYELMKNNLETHDGPIEPILDPENFRFTVKPINPKYDVFWSLLKKQQSCYWIAEEIDFSKDYDDFIDLTPSEQHFIKRILAFFAASDGIVNFNLRERFLREIQVTEAQIAYGYQLMMENTHGEIYSDMLINVVKNPNEQKELFDAIKTIDSVKMMADWALKWISSYKSFAYRNIAFCIVEGIFFSGAFAAIFWLKKERGRGKLFMEGLMKSNRFISRDEGLHVNFGCAVYNTIENRVPFEEVKEMFIDANKICKAFTDDAIPCKMIGMNVDLMTQYTEYVSDRLLVMLNYDKIYNSTNPFDFMESIGFLSKDNFFENRPDSYQQSHNKDNTADWTFKRLEDF
jgi:ribonucleoside-diphosphate reductase beta chain